MVDPSDSKKIHQYLKNSNEGQSLFNQKSLSTILTTHKHWDHAGGNLYFVKNWKEFSSLEKVQVVGNGECEGVNQELKSDLESFTIFDDKTVVQAYHTPCHTNGHVCYLVRTSDEEGGNFDCLFCGDTFFVGGCGKFFEGTAQQMFDNIVKLNKEIKDPERMLLCCGHEYTLKNMQFIVDKISDTETSRKYLNKYKNLMEESHGTVPSTWQDEKEYNPYFKAALLESFETRREFFDKMIKDGSATEDDLKTWSSVKILQTVRDLKDKY